MRPPCDSPLLSLELWLVPTKLGKLLSPVQLLSSVAGYLRRRQQSQKCQHQNKAQTEQALPAAANGHGLARWLAEVSHRTITDAHQ